MVSLLSGRSKESVKLPNHTLLYGIVLAALGALVAAGALTRIYELRELFPLKLEKEVNELILGYIPFILGTFITTAAALAGLIVGLSWALSGLREITRLRVVMDRPGDYYEPEGVSLGLKDGRIHAYDRSPSLLFFILGRVWSNAGRISEIPGEVIRRNVRFLWTALLMGFAIHFLFRLLSLLPQHLEAWGLGSGYVIPSPAPFYNLLILVCVFKLVIAFSLIPLRKPPMGREMDSMIVEGKGHPSVFFAILEEGSRIFAHRGFPNRVSRSKPVICEDNETLIGTLIESFPEYIRTSCRFGALLGLLLGSVMVLVGFLQIILTQYPTFSVGYEDFFRLYALSLIVDIALNVAIILFGKGFIEQARSLMSVYRFRSNIVYVEAKGDFEKQVLPDLEGIVSPERLFNPLSRCAFNVRYFSAEAVSEAVSAVGMRDLVGLETSGRVAKDVGRLKYLPFQVDFNERYPSSWTSIEYATGSPDAQYTEDEAVTATVEGEAEEAPRKESPPPIAVP